MSNGRTARGWHEAHRMLGHAVKTAQHALRGRMDAELRALGLTTPQYAALASLEREAGASNAVLARLAFVTPQTMQAIVTKLERSGHVLRTPHPEHGRIQTTELTEAGRAALEAAHAVAVRVEALTRTAAAPLDPDAVTEMLLRLAGTLRDGPKARTGGTTIRTGPASFRL